MKNFILFGASGYVAPRHMNAIKTLGHNLLAVYDPHDGIGILDSYFPNAAYFNEFERLDRFIAQKINEGLSIDYLSICSPNYLHDAHIRYGLRIGAEVICEKPLVLNPWNLNSLEIEEAKANKKVHAMLQLRHHPEIVALKEKIQKSDKQSYLIDLRYITARGSWYRYSWKGDEVKSGGIATNIGIHFFDMLTWIFGEMKSLEVTQNQFNRASGMLHLERADVTWFLSIDQEDLPEDRLKEGKRTYRMMTIDGALFDFTEGLENLHTAAYQAVLAGKSYGISEARPSIEIVSQIRNLKA
ncbi:MAG: Gfo/Idh/MocA family oxidoreductase [Chitinophagales bacterium]|jgi:UDP-N-acetyl-2-amino-2-deoxyglucuronate dehydrogenase|nr:Gfo/Idh/MocA family oxidoreductase [Chitinophagales bacterium]